MVPYNYIFEVYPLLQKRKGLKVDINETYLGNKSKWTNFIISEKLIKYRGVLYVIVGTFLHVSGIQTRLINFDSLAFICFPSSALLLLVGGVYTKLWLKGFKMEDLYNW